MNRKRTITSAVLMLIVLAGVGAFALSAYGGFPGERTGPRTEWKKNAYGVTYGSSLDASSYEDEPELVLVVATNGKQGYCYRTEMEGPTPSSPAAAVAMTKAKGGRPDVIPVYDVDGVKQIGVFLVEHPTGVEFTK